MHNQTTSLKGENDEVRTAAIYARTSSPNQRYNHSIGEQIDQCWKHCEQRDWEIHYTFIDECISGGTIDRPKFQLMLDNAKNGYFDVIVFWKLDRFCRSLVDLINTERQLRDWNVNLCSVTEFIDTTSTVGRFNFRNLASVAEFEREIIGDRARMGLHALAKKHKWPNPHPPLGYGIGSDGKLVINIEEARLVHTIFSRYLKTKSMPQLAYDLNQQGHNTKKGNRWNDQSIRQVLSNELYIGSYNVAGFKDYVEEYKIIDEELYKKVSDTRNRFRKGYGKQHSIPLDRRRETVDHVFRKYNEFLIKVGETEAYN